jgi:AcrR family transcriptional regulator
MSSPRVRKEPLKIPAWSEVPDTPRSRRHPQMRRAIVHAALELADAEGIDAVSMRRIATTLDMGTMTLYSYVPAKSDLLALMAEEIGSEMLVPGELPADWREALRAIAHRTRAMILRHPWVTTLEHEPFISPSIARHIEQSFAALAPLGLDPDDAGAILQAIDAYTGGSALDELEDRGREDSEDWQRIQTELLERAVGAHDLPHLAAALAAGMTDRGQHFERGLDWLLAGVAAEVEPRLH